MKINIRTNDTVLTATLLGSKAARDFASLSGVGFAYR